MAFDAATAQLPVTENKTSTVKSMAYNSMDAPSMTVAHITRQVHRLSRGFPYQKQGGRQIVYQVPKTAVATKNVVSSNNVLPSYPQFKTHYIYAPAAGQVQNQFRQQLVQSTRVRWPVPNTPVVGTGL